MSTPRATTTNGAPSGAGAGGFARRPFRRAFPVQVRTSANRSPRVTGAARFTGPPLTPRPAHAGHPWRGRGFLPAGVPHCVCTPSPVKGRLRGAGRSAHPSRCARRAARPPLLGSAFARPLTGVGSPQRTGSYPAG